MDTLRESLGDYLAMRRSLGFKLHDAGLTLPRFVAFMEAHEAPYITTLLAQEWAQQPSAVSAGEWARRLSFVRGFARYRSAIDGRTQIPPPGLLPYRPKRAIPYIYSDEEVQRLLAAALTLPPPGEFRAKLYHCLLGLFAVTGLRLSEALHLKLDDVNLHDAVLTIRDTKFGKSRLVPLHTTTVSVLADYLHCRELFLGRRPACYVFISIRGNGLDKGELHRTFYRLSRQVGLRGPTASHGPRLHDFRHRFASTTLLRWYQSGEDIEQRLPVLSAYLGHVHIADTYWYLSAIPELMTLATQRLEQQWGERS
jgi:integrase/recombinase XerD